MLKPFVYLSNRLAGLRSDRGVTSVEYGLMVALIAIVIIGGAREVSHAQRRRLRAQVAGPARQGG